MPEQNFARALQILQQTFGYKSFRPAQETVVKSLLEGREPAEAVETQTADRQRACVGRLREDSGSGCETALGVIGTDLETHLALEGMGGTDDGKGEQHLFSWNRDVERLVRDLVL